MPRQGFSRVPRKQKGKRWRSIRQLKGNGRKSDFQVENFRAPAAEPTRNLDLSNL